MSKVKRHLITSALPYANGPLHIGHVAGAYLPADIYVRYLRLKGEDAVWVCGSDEHGAAITIRAMKEGVTPREIVDKYHEIIEKSFADFGISFDIYDRTSSPEHHLTAQEFFKTLNDKGVFEKKSSMQFYDDDKKQFLADRYIMGSCPKCSHDKAYGDQCEKCGATLSPSELINPKSTISGSTPVMKETSHWYLPMEKHDGWLREYIERGMLDGQAHHDPRLWKAHVLGQCKSWIDGGLQSRAMTRDLDWGVPVPLEGADGKVLYVWLDAPIGYISATKAWAEKSGRNWREFWQSPDSRLVHFIGKDNIVFHCIIFPILLKAHGDFVLPENVPANEFMNLEGEKISTSRNWAVWLHEYLEEFPGKQDELRYVLCGLMPEQKDSEFTWQEYKDRINNELADVLGNFVNRAIVLTHKYYDGMIPQPAHAEPFDIEVAEAIGHHAEKVGRFIEAFRFRDALNEAMGLIRLGNKYLTDTEPWKLQKTDPDRVRTIMHNTLQITASASVLLEPFLPFTCEKIRTVLGLSSIQWSDACAKLLTPGASIGSLPILFTKLEANVPATPAKEDISFEEFIKSDLRIGTILAAEKVAKADKLLKLTVDTGIDQRTVVSGIAQFYKPEDIVGKRVAMIVNLAPRNIRGIESRGMILMAEGPDGNLSFLAPESDTITPGSSIR
jgi:methionyl-tRNA synthetase